MTKSDGTSMVEQWNGVVEQWNSVGQFCGILEQCGRTEEKYGKMWWNIKTVEQYGETEEQCEE